MARKPPIELRRREMIKMIANGAVTTQPNYELLRAFCKIIAGEDISTARTYSSTGRSALQRRIKHKSEFIETDVEQMARELKGPDVHFVFECP